MCVLLQGLGCVLLQAQILAPFNWDGLRLEIGLTEEIRHCNIAGCRALVSVTRLAGAAGKGLLGWWYR